MGFNSGFKGLIRLLALSDSERKMFLTSPMLFYIPQTISLTELPCFNALYSHSSFLDLIPGVVSVLAPAPCGRYILPALAFISVGFVQCFAKSGRPSRKLHQMNICKYVCFFQTRNTAQKSSNCDRFGSSNFSLSFAFFCLSLILFFSLCLSFHHLYLLLQDVATSKFLFYFYIFTSFVFLLIYFFLFLYSLLVEYNMYIYMNEETRMYRSKIIKQMAIQN